MIQKNQMQLSGKKTLIYPKLTHYETIKDKAKLKVNLQCHASTVD